MSPNTLPQPYYFKTTPTHPTQTVTIYPAITSSPPFLNLRFFAANCAGVSGKKVLGLEASLRRSRSRAQRVLTPASMEEEKEEEEEDRPKLRRRRSEGGIRAERELVMGSSVSLIPVWKKRRKRRKKKRRRKTL